MSNVSKKTEYRALKIIARMVKDFERLDYLDITKLDDWNSRRARQLLERIVRLNGYKINYDRNSKKPLFKIKTKQNEYRFFQTNEQPQHCRQFAGNNLQRRN